MIGLNKSATPAEILSECSLSQNLNSREEIISNGGTIVGSPTFDRDGVILDGSNDYVTFPLMGEFWNGKISVECELWPDFEADDGLDHMFFDTTNTERYFAIKNSLDQIRVYAGGSVLILLASLGSFSSIWKVGKRNVIQISANDGYNELWLNGVSLTSSSVSWSPAKPIKLWIGSDLAGGAKFDGKIGSFKVFKSLLDGNDALAYYNRNMYSYRDCSAILDLPMRAENHDPDNVQTLDISGGKFNRNNNHATFGDGSTPTTYPTKLQKRGYSFDGGDWLDCGNDASIMPTETITVAAVVKADYLTSLRFIAGTSPIGGGASSGFMLFHNANLWRFSINHWSSNSAYSAWNDSETGKYVTVIGTYDKTTIEIYINGVKGTSDAYSTSINYPVGSSVSFGRMGAESLYYWDGDIDSGMIVPFALSSIQVKDLHLQMIERAGLV